MIVAIFASPTLTADSGRVQQCMRFALTRLESKLAIQHGKSNPWPEQAFIHGDGHIEREMAVWIIEQGVSKKRVREIPINVEKHGDKAKAARDRILVKNAHSLVAIWDGREGRVRQAIQRATDKGIPVVVEVIT